jgi:uncharacterized protein
MKKKSSQSQQITCHPAGNDSFKCEFISFNYVVRLSRILAQKIKASGYMPDLIVAIGRGGYVPGRLICDYLLFSNLTSMKIEHYTRAADMQPEAKIKFPISVDISGKNVLIVDDVTDTGETLTLALNYIWSLKPSEVKTAVLQHKICSPLVPDFYAQKVIKWRWIIYPWARYEDLAGFSEKIIRDRALDIFQIISELKARYELDVKETEILEILKDLTERGEMTRTEGNLPVWKVLGEKQSGKEQNI